MPHRGLAAALDAAAPPAAVGRAKVSVAGPALASIYLTMDDFTMKIYVEERVRVS